MQRTDIATAAREHLNELGNDYVTGTILTNAVKRATRRLNRQAAYYRGDVSITLTNRTREYTLSGSVLEVQRARIGTGADRDRLSPTDLVAMDRDDPDWEAATAGTPTHYYTNGQVIGFKPLPRTAGTTWGSTTYYGTGGRILPTTDNGFVYKVNTAGTSGTTQPTWPTTLDGTVSETNGPVYKQAGHTRIYLRCIRTPPDLSTATSAPTWLPTDFHDTIAIGAALELAGIFDADDATNDARAQRLYNLYLQDLADLTKLGWGRARDYRPRMTFTGYGTFRR